MVLANREAIGTSTSSRALLVSLRAISGVGILTGTGQFMPDVPAAAIMTVRSPPRTRLELLSRRDILAVSEHSCAGASRAMRTPHRHVAQVLR